MLCGGVGVQTPRIGKVDGLHQLYDAIWKQTARFGLFFFVFRGLWIPLGGNMPLGRGFAGDAPGRCRAVRDGLSACR